MATILLSAAGAAIGSGFGGTVLGLSGAVIGRAVGATIGQAIDQRILGAGAAPVEQGRIQRFALSSASEGAPIPRVWGKMRVAGEVIWATRFLETANRTQGGKGSPRPSTTNYSYTISLAIALAQGEARRLGRIWADGMEIAKGSLDIRFYPGSEDQMPDPKIEAVEGAGLAPAYRGIAYVVIEDLDLSRFGNRVPQFTFEIFRSADVAEADLADVVQAVALIPGTGEYALATTQVTFNDGPGVSRTANVHSVEDKTDFSLSLEQLGEELPKVGSVSLVTSWFGDDLRCNLCTIRPKVDQSSEDGAEMAWRVSGLTRTTAQVLPQVEGRAIYGGTPADASVIEAIQAIRGSGKEVMFYPFILMDQIAGNTKPDPWSSATTQPALPWRGRITLSVAPGRAGSPDRSATAAAQVASFLGSAPAGSFSHASGQVVYSGPADWGYRRFILHYAHLCALAGGVDAFCIGSELRGLTQIRDAADAFPMVAGLRQLAAEVSAVLPAAKVSYAADWTEYGSYEADGNVYFPLDPLWGDSNIDFVGIDNYLPLSDWRDGTDHLDAAWGSIYNLDYLKANVAGGEYYDWFYASDVAAAAQLRQPITDGAYGEPWVFRRKDLKGWWSHAHFPRIGGVRQASPTAWVAGSKPIRFTEYGCAAIDKASNQPNVFLDAFSSESALPRASSGRRDDLIQLQYLRAMHGYWNDAVNNPSASLYTGKMLDLGRSHVWAWDARPFPVFPTDTATWSDGQNYYHGHWLNGRTGGQPLSAVIADICAEAGLTSGVDSAAAHGMVRGYIVGEIGTARQALQPLSTAYGLNIAEREGVLRFSLRSGVATVTLDRARLAVSSELESGSEATRGADLDSPGRIQLNYVEAEGDYETRSTEAIFPDETSAAVSSTEMALQLTNSEARAVAERWLVESRVARDGLRLALPRSQLALGAGDLVKLDGQSWRIDKVEQGEMQVMEAVRVDHGAYLPAEDVDYAGTRAAGRSSGAGQVFPLFLDLPLLTGDENPVAPHVAATVSPWSGAVGVWASSSSDGFALNSQLDNPAILGLTMTEIGRAEPGIWDHGPALRVKLSSGQLFSASEDDVLNGANVAAIGDGTAGNWEIIQFQEAVLVAPRTYDIRLRLRGQAGTDAVAPEAWPVGSYFVLLDGSVPQIDLPISARGLTRNYRVGALEKGYADSKVVSRTLAFDGIGLRPYSVAHLTATGALGQTITLDWIRRTRIDGDSWQSVEVPLGEESELYQITVQQGATILRQETSTLPSWSYSVAQQLADGAGPGVRFSVAQVSNRFGPGPAVSVAA